MTFPFQTSQILPFIIQQLVISSSLQGTLKCLNLRKLNTYYSPFKTASVLGVLREH